MRNAERWEPTKYDYRCGRLRASTNTSHLAVGSRLVANLVAERYDLALDMHARGRLLDLGCGRVPFYGAYAQKVDSVVTLDWSGADNDRTHVDFEHDLNTPLPFGNSTFDVVVLSDVLEHIREPQQLCMEISRVLTKCGVLIGNTPFLYPIHEAPHDYYRFTEHGLRHLFSAATLKVLALEPLGGSIDVGCDILAKHLSRLSAPGRLAAAMMQSSVGWFGSTRLGTHFRRSTSSRFCCSYFFVSQRL